MLGKLSWSALPLGQPIPLFAGGFVVVVILGVLALVTVKGWWPYLWREWITSVDHSQRPKVVQMPKVHCLPLDRMLPPPSPSRRGVVL